MLAPSIADTLNCMATPNCVGILGPWGSGKTTLVQWVQDELGRKPGTKVQTLFFETWKYDQGDGLDVVYALVSAIQRKLCGDASDKERDARELRKDLLTIVLAAGSTLARVGTLGLAHPLGDAETAGRMVDAALANEDTWVSAVDQLQRRFKKTIEAGLRRCEADRLVVFLDDLDRCLPHNVVTLLERLKNFLMVEGVIFVIAADRAAIVEAICKTYGYSTSFGDRYLDKITTINFEIASKPSDELFSDLLVDAVDALGIQQTVGAQHPLMLYHRFLPLGLDNPRIARKVAVKFAILAGGPVPWVITQRRGPDPDEEFIRTFLKRGSLPANADKAALAQVHLWKTAFAVTSLRQVYPTAFSSYNEALFSALQLIARPGPDLSRHTDSVAARDVVRRAGIPDAVAVDLADALFMATSTEWDFTTDELKYVYDKLGPWL